MKAKRNAVASMGAIFSPIDVRDYKPAEVARAMEYPTAFSVELGKVKNQGAVSSCVAHSLSEVLEYSWRDKNIDMSVGFIYGNRKTSDYKEEGMIVRDALKALNQYGDVENSKFDYNKEVPKVIELFEEKYPELKDGALPFKIEKYYRCNTPEEMKTALMVDGPLVFAMKWFSDIKVGKDGIMKSTWDPNLNGGGHCMVIYGWNENGWLIRNSWGTTWGKGGNAILPFDAPIRECWGIRDEIDENDVDIVKPYNNKVAQFFAKIINFFANLFKKKDA